MGPRCPQCRVWFGARGLIHVLRSDEPFPCGRCGAALHLELPIPTTGAVFLGTAVAILATTFGTRWCGLAFLAWLFLSPAMILALIRWRVRRTEPHCAVCDYDLRGLTTRVCPECGARIFR